MLSSSEALINEISTNSLKSLEIIQGGIEEKFTDKDYITRVDLKQSNGCNLTNNVVLMTLMGDLQTLRLNRMAKPSPLLEKLSKNITLPCKTHFVHAIAPSEDYIIIGTENGYVSVIDVETLNIIVTQQLLKSDITHIKHDPKSNLIIISSLTDKTFSLTNENSFFFRYHPDDKKFTPVEVNQTDLDLILQAVKINTSIEQLTIKNRELNQKNIDSLFAVIQSRPGLKCDFSDSINQQLNLKRTLESTVQQNQSLSQTVASLQKSLQLKSQEVESLKLKHANEESDMLVRFKEREKSLTEQVEKKDQEIHQLHERERDLQAELKNTTEKIFHLNQIFLEQKQQREVEMQKAGEIHANLQREIQQRDLILKAISAKQKQSEPKSLRKKIDEAKSLDQSLLRQLLNEQSIQYWDLMKFRDDQVIQDAIDNIVAKKAIIDIRSLIMAINSIDINTQKDETDQLTYIIDHISNFTMMPTFVKNEMKDIIKSNSEILLLNKAAKKQYDDYVKSWRLSVKEQLYSEEDDFNIESIKVSKKKNDEALSDLLDHPNTKDVEIAIQSTVKGFLNELLNKKISDKFKLQPSFASNENEKSLDQSFQKFHRGLI